MAKTAKRHRCIDCGSTTARWAGRCPTCGEWNTLVEESQLGPLVRAVDDLDLSMMPVPLSSVDVSEAVAIPTGVEEFDRVLSGGLVPGEMQLTFTAIDGIEPPPVELAGADSSAD